jgi:hypothetical protein
MNVNDKKLAQSLSVIIHEYKREHNVPGYERVDFENVIDWAATRPTEKLEKLNENRII